MNDTYDDIEPGDDNLDENCANEENYDTAEIKYCKKCGRELVSTNDTGYCENCRQKSAGVWGNIVKTVSFFAAAIVLLALKGVANGSKDNDSIDKDGDMQF